MAATLAPPFRRFLAALGALSLLATACSSGSDSTSPRVEPVTNEKPTSTTGSTPTTRPPDHDDRPPAAAVDPAGHPTPPPVDEYPDGSLRPGSQGPKVKAMQVRLAALKYDVGAADGKYGPQTVQAVMAFQKWEGLTRDGVAGAVTRKRLAVAKAPTGQVAGGEATRVEFDRNRQVLLIFVGGSLYRALNASSGSGIPYCENGYCGDARTPDGAYRVYKRISGWRIGPLGGLYNPLYFNGGIAIHGSFSVPAYPASHGCVRISMYSAEWVPGVVPDGAPVYVIGSYVPSALGGGTTTPTEPEPTTTSAKPTTTKPTTTTTKPPKITTTTAP